MTEEAITQLVSLNKKRHVLEVLRDAFSQNISNKEILMEDYGLSPDEIKWFFKEVLLEEEEELLVSRLLPIVDRMIMEIEDKILEVISEHLKGMRIVIFNDWKDLIGSKWTGSFRGRGVERIEEDKVIIFTTEGKEWRGIGGEKNIVFIGPGIYYSKFYLKGMKDFVMHYVPIHGVILPSHILEKAQRSPPLTYGKFSSHYRKYITNISMDYNLYDPEDAARLKRIYTRIMYENLSIFEIFLKSVREMINIVETKDIRFISALPEYFNKILVTKENYERIVQSNEANIPGLMGYEAGIENILDAITVDLEETLIILKELKTRFMNYGWEVIKRVLPR